MAVLVTCKFDDNSTKNEGTTRNYCVHNIFSIISLWEKFSALKGNSKANIRTGPKSKFIQAFMPVLVTYKFEEDPIKNNIVSQYFPHYTSIGVFGCRGNQSFDSICPKILCSLSPTQWCFIFNLIKIGQLVRDIHVSTCGRWRTNAIL